MTTDTAAAAVALTLYVAGLVTAFGVRSWVHHRRTGTTGFRGLTGAAGSAEWWGEILFAAALVLGAASVGSWLVVAESEVSATCTRHTSYHPLDMDSMYVFNQSHGSCAYFSSLHGRRST